MMSISLKGQDALHVRFEAFPAALVTLLAAKAARLADALADKVKSEKLSGGVLNAVSGALRESIVAEIAVESAGVLAQVASLGNVKYAAIQEYGGKTAAHDILPAKGKALAFARGGASVFAAHVTHPGSVIPERSYLRSSLAEMGDEIVAAFAEAPYGTWASL
jgi:phage gpG-like protein